MLGDPTSDIQRACLQSNPRFQLISFDELEEAERRTFESLSEEPDFYGLLIPPPGSALPVKSMSRDAALLFQRLRKPGRIPHLLKSIFGTNIEIPLKQLILDGILEIESEGRFLSGPSTFQQTGTSINKPTTHIAKLSQDAIKYGTELQGLSVSELANRLYMFNRVPCTPAHQRQFAETEQVIAYLIRGSTHTKKLLSRWNGEIRQGAWFEWRSAESFATLAFKLYISPTIDTLPETFRLTVEALAAVQCKCFKVGLTAFGLLRPDKLVAYFARLEDLQHAAELLQASATGSVVQGVPFTAAIDPDGLISWGMDPPRFEQRLEAQRTQSWRQWVAERIAIYTIAAKENGIEDTTDFILRRIALDGVDTDTWSPNLAIWRGLAGS